MSTSPPPLTNCPVCRYDLHGLPEEHRCPACGFEYDDSTQAWLTPSRIPSAILIFSIPIVVLATGLIASAYAPGGFTLRELVVAAIPLAALGAGAMARHLCVDRSFVAITERGLTYRVLLRGVRSLAWKDIYYPKHVKEPCRYAHRGVRPLSILSAWVQSGLREEIYEALREAWDRYVTPDMFNRRLLAKCPSCWYDLRGLPRAHRCPECGFFYDDSTIVFWSPRGAWMLLGGPALVSLALVPLLRLTEAIGLPKAVGFLICTVWLALLLASLLAGPLRLLARTFVAVGRQGLAFRTFFGSTRQFDWSELFVRRDSVSMEVHRTVGEDPERLRLPLSVSGDATEAFNEEVYKRWVAATGPGMHWTVMRPEAASGDKATSPESERTDDSP